MSSHFSEYVDLSCDDYLIHICRPFTNFVHSIMVTAKATSLDRPAALFAQYLLRDQGVAQEGIAGDIFV